ncbi:protein FAM171A2 isoform X2 [Brachyhypopomus gauderio]|uniref:protein FAM171A2 isoform X2 n=1 Tax=Brachyhypopomus gauderio TaxID=698409 RepID=UPI004041E6EA
MDGHPKTPCDVPATMSPLHTLRFFVLYLCLCGVCRTRARPTPEPGALEVLIKVQVFDNSDLSPLKEAAVQVYGNQSTLVSGLAGEDGVVTVTFLYRPGSWVIVAASKHGFVTNSAPWHANRIPLYASVSLYLLPQRPATLLLYDDVVQLLLGSPGSRRQPWVQVQRRAIQPALNTSHISLSAMLTSTRSQYELGGFPYPLGLENNSTGSNSSWVELTAVAAVCAILTGPNGTLVRVTDPIHVSVPLPTDSPLQTATSVPIWRFEERSGLWLRSGTGYISRDGTHMTCSFVAPHLGYWLAAFPLTPGTILNPSGLRDITTYHTIFLLTILGSMALLVLILLCLLLYYCRRCLKPRQNRRKRHLSTLESYTRDQGTSTPHLNLISGGPVETASSIGDACGVKSGLSPARDLRGSREDFFGRGPKPQCSTGSSHGRHGEAFPPHATHSPHTSHLEPLQQRGYGSAQDGKENQASASDAPSPFTDRYHEHGRDGKPPEYSDSQATDRANGQLFFCRSVEQMKEGVYRGVVPTLVIPAHYVRLSSDLSAVEQAVERQQQLQHDMEAIQVSMTLPRAQNQHQKNQQEQAEPGEDGTATAGESSGPVHIPVLFDESQMNSELKALTEKKLLELGVKPHPLAWFVSLDGRSNALVRHSYIEVGNEPLGQAGQEHRAETYPGNASRASQRKMKEESRAKEGAERKALGKIRSRLPVINSAARESRTAARTCEDGTVAHAAQESRGTCPLRRRGQDDAAEVTSPDDDYGEDKDEEGENKKSPWQKREERPLMVFK